MTLPLPSFLTHWLLLGLLAVVHLYLGCVHVLALAGGAIEWTHAWKGVGALVGAYVLAALALRGRAKAASRSQLPAAVAPRPAKARIRLR